MPGLRRAMLLLCLAAVTIDGHRSMGLNKASKDNCKPDERVAIQLKRKQRDKFKDLKSMEQGMGDQDQDRLTVLSQALEAGYKCGTGGEEANKKAIKELTIELTAELETFYKQVVDEQKARGLLPHNLITVKRKPKTFGKVKLDKKERSFSDQSSSGDDVSLDSRFSDFSQPEYPEGSDKSYYFDKAEEPNDGDVVDIDLQGKDANRLIDLFSLCRKMTRSAKIDLFNIKEIIEAGYVWRDTLTASANMKERLKKTRIVQQLIRKLFVEQVKNMVAKGWLAKHGCLITVKTDGKQRKYDEKLAEACRDRLEHNLELCYKEPDLAEYIQQLQVARSEQPKPDIKEQNNLDDELFEMDDTEKNFFDQWDP